MKVKRWWRKDFLDTTPPQQQWSRRRRKLFRLSVRPGLKWWYEDDDGNV